MERFKKYTYEIVLGVLALAYLVFKIVVFKNIPLEEYPYLHQDLWRRLSDAMFYLGQGKAAFMHPPLPSLLYIPFLLVGGRFMYLINVFGFVLQMMLFFLLTSKITGDRRAGLAAAVLFFANYYNNHAFDFYGLVDGLCTTFILAAVYFWIRDSKKMTNFLWSGILLGIAGLTQYAGVFMGPMLIIYDLIQAKSFRILWQNKWKYILAGASSLVIFGVFFVYRYFRFGSFTYSQVEHFGLLTVTLKGVPVYLLYAFMFWGIPLILFALFGIYLALKEKKQIYQVLKFSIIFLPYIVFFAFFYKWTDSRFVIYYSLPIYIFAGISLSWLWEQTKKASNPIEMKVLLTVLLLLVFNYMNLSSNGVTGVIIGRQRILHVNEGKTNVVQVEFPFKNYFSALADYHNNRTGNEELQYFSKTVSPLKIVPMVDTIKMMNIDPSKILLDLHREPFVTSQQLSYYLGIVYPFEFYDQDKIFADEKSGKYNYLLTDSELSIDTKNTLIYQNEGLYLYAIVEGR